MQQQPCPASSQEFSLGLNKRSMMNPWVKLVFIITHATTPCPASSQEFSLGLNKVL